MGFNEFISKLFGNKAQRDMKEMMPILEKIKAVYPQIEQLDNGGLRTRAQAVKIALPKAYVPNATTLPNCAEV